MSKTIADTQVLACGCLEKRYVVGLSILMGGYMVINPTDHELNAVLARVKGVQIYEGEAARQKFWWHVNPTREKQVWSPVTCPIQMERVENALAARADMVEFYVAWVPKRQMWEAFLAKVDTVGYPVFHADKKRAFALALWQMEQSNNNNNKED